MNIVQSLLSAISPLPDGDLSDRLNYCYTSTLLVICSAFISGWSFVGQPIQCWFPSFFRGWWIEYALDYCFVQNTYFVGFTEMKPDNFFDIAKHIIPIPKNVTDRDQKQIGYYQWVPFILALQALLFYLPVALWRTIYNSVGFKVKTICETCSINANMEPDARSKNMAVVARFLIYDNELTTTLGGRIKHALEGRIVLFTYITVKVLYTLNALFQFLIVKWLLGTDSIFWGLNVAQDLVIGREWPETGNFPRVTLCDFTTLVLIVSIMTELMLTFIFHDLVHLQKVRVLGNLHRHSVQCVLMINMFNEKIFVFLWFWFCFLAIYSVINLVYWLVISLNAKGNERMIRSYLEKIEPSAAHGGLSFKNQMRGFIRRALQPDGLFLIRLITANSGNLVTCELISTLWRDYLETQPHNTATHGRLPPPYDEPVPLLLKDENEKNT